MIALLPAVLIHQPTVLATEEIAARLTEHARQAQGALAPETERALRKASAAFSSWAAAQGVTALPASPETLAAYVDALSDLGRKPASIRQAVWAVATLQRAAALPDPSKAEVVRLALKRMARTLGTRQRQAAPLGKAEINRIFDTAGMTLPECRDIALLLTMRDMLARRSEAVALEVADLKFAADGSATVLIKRSKTDQAGAGEVCWLGPRTVRELHRWLDAARITDGPIFRPVSRTGVVGPAALASSEVPRILKRLAERAGLEPEAISGHSLRVGMAQDLVAGGADLPAVMQAGRWKSPTMPARYAERLLAGRGAVARLHDRQRGVGSVCFQPSAWQQVRRRYRRSPAPRQEVDSRSWQPKGGQADSPAPTRTTKINHLDVRHKLGRLEERADAMGSPTSPRSRLNTDRVVLGSRQKLAKALGQPAPR